jgi:phosphoribosylcarboxyaminoimidazole (NCAIR) mutase
MSLNKYLGGSQMKVAIVMGSKSDYPVVERAEAVLKEFNVQYETRVISAHRTPRVAENFATNAEDEGFELIIAAAGKAAHLGGVLAAFTPLPVIGLPIKSSTLDGLDSLLSIVQSLAGKAGEQTLQCLICPIRLLKLSYISSSSICKNFGWPQF